MLLLRLRVVVGRCLGFFLVCAKGDERERHLCTGPCVQDDAACKWECDYCAVAQQCRAMREADAPF